MHIEARPPTATRVLWNSYNVHGAAHGGQCTHANLNDPDAGGHW